MEYSGDRRLVRVVEAAVQSRLMLRRDTRVKEENPDAFSLAILALVFFSAIMHREFRILTR
jgi:hypothetical protein